MTSQVTSQQLEPPVGYSNDVMLNNGSVPGSASSSVTGESGGSTAGVPDVLNLPLMLPNGDSKFISIDSCKQMMDLSVQLSAANRLSPAGHTIQVLAEDTDRPVDYHPSQTLASVYAHVGPLTLCIVTKKADFQAEKKIRENSRMANQPFEKTQRLTVNLPQNQKALLRVSPRSSVVQILHMVCKEKNLNPTSHVIRHPKNPEVEMDPKSTLQEHGLAEVTLVLLDGGKARPWPGPSEHVTSSNDVERAPGEANNMSKKDEYTSGYMPGMESKKKKGFFSKIFSRKKGDTFNVADATHSTSHSTAHRSQQPPSARHSTLGVPSSASTPLSSAPPPAQTNHHLKTQQQHPIQSHRATVAGIPAKPPRKKRPAPPPPTMRPQQPQQPKPTDDAQTENHATINVVVHSRTSSHDSHSSGFAEGDISPLGSPSNSSRQDGVGDEATRGSIEGLNNVLLATHRDASQPVSSSSESGSVPSTTRRKKRRAPLPPGVKPQTVEIPPPSVPADELQSSQQQGGSTIDSQSDLSGTDTISRPCYFVPPPPPDTPPPTGGPAAAGLDHSKDVNDSSMVSDSSTQVHVSIRDSLSSDPGQKSDLAAYVDQLDELTENVYQEDHEQRLSTHDDSADGVPQHDVNHNLDAPEAPPVEFQDPDTSVAIEKTEKDATVVKISAHDSGEMDFEDTMQAFDRAFDNIENDDETQQSNMGVEEITLDTQTEENSFVSTVRVGGDGVEADSDTQKGDRQGATRVNADGFLEMEEITFDHTEVEYVAPENKSSEDETEVVFFSEDGQSWDTDTAQQPQEDVQGHHGGETLVVKGPDTEMTSRPLSENEVFIPEEEGDIPNAYTVTVTKEYVISLKPGEFEYPPLPESAKKTQEPEEIPKKKKVPTATLR